MGREGYVWVRKGLGGELNPTWPAPPIIISSILVLNEVPMVPGLLVDPIIVVLFYMRVHNGDHLTPLGRDISDHFGRVGELVSVPSEVAGRQRAKKVQGILSNH